MSLSISGIKTINLKISLTFFTLIVLISSTILYFNHKIFNDTITKSQRHLSRTILQILQESIGRISFAGNYHAQIFVDSLVEKEKDLLFIYIINDDNKKIALSKKDSFTEEIDYTVEKYYTLFNFDHKKNSLYVEHEKENNDDQYVFNEYKKCCNNIQYYEIAMPYTASYDNSKKGIIVVGISAEDVKTKLTKNIFLSLIIGAFTSILGLTIILQLAKKLTAPVNNLALTFQGLLNHAPFNIVIRKQNGQVVEISENYKMIFEKDFKSSLNKKSYINQWKYAFKEIDDYLSKNSNILKKEFHFLNEDVDEYFTTISFQIVQKNPSLEYFCTIAINTSDEHKIRKVLEAKTYEAKRASIAKTSFLATMSHEIRTPLTSILGFLGLLEESILSEKQEKYVKTALGASENLMALINDILDYSKIESNDFKLEYSPMSLKNLFSDLSGIFEHQVKEKNLSFDLELDAGIKSIILADQLRLRQIFINLIGNAIKFTSNGGIKIKIELQKIENQRQFIRFHVIDTGIGIEEKQISHIFEEFTQADNSISRRFGGTGLGLSITKKLITLMGGDIYVTSKFGKGSTFFFDLDFDYEEEALISSPTHQDGKDLETLYENKLILVVDDEDSNRQLINLYLSKLGLNMDFCDNGKDAVDMALKKSYDMILMDIQMPQYDGVKALQMIREEEALRGSKKTKVYAFTANVFKEQLDEYRLHGFDGHLLKPFKKKELIDFINNHI